MDDHAAICSVCGDRLGPPPSSSRNNSSSSRTMPNHDNVATIRAIPEFLTDDLREATQGIFSDLGQIASLNGDTRNMGQEWQQVPAHILDPQSHSHSRPTSKEVLDKLPRITLEESSSLFHQATVNLLSSSTTNNDESITHQQQQQQQQQQQLFQFQAIRGEFGPSKAMALENRAIIVASPRTGKGGTLDKETLEQIAGSTPSAIVYMERGDGITFVQKALMAQAAGASGVIIGNNMVSPWPYVMKDSKKEAETGGLSIPVVMVKMEDGKKIVDQCLYGEMEFELKCTLNIQALSKDCVVCCDTFAVSDKVLQLPSCGHVFHEQCALTWLTKQNTCPFCRRELPTDDQEYENERRRTQRTHAGSSTAGHSTGYEAFYG
jgi:hypothetical protein